MISVSAGGRENRNGDEPEDEPEEAEHPPAGPSGTAQVQMVTGNVTLACTRGIFFHIQSAHFLIDFFCSPFLPAFPGGACCPY